MVAPLLGALARGAAVAAKGAAKSAAKTATKTGKAIKKKPTKKRDRGDRSKEYARYNERRRAKRAAARLEKQAKAQSGKTRQETLSKATQLLERVAESYVDRATGQYKRMVGELESFTTDANQFYQERAQKMTSLSDQENARRSAMLKNYFRSASKTQAQLEDRDFNTPQQQLSRLEQSRFYAATKPLWMNGDARYRDENIIEAMSGIRLESGRYISNLQDAFEYIKQNDPNWPTLEKVMKGEIDTDDYDFQGEQEEETGSPPVYTLSDFRAMGAFV